MRHLKRSPPRFTGYYHWPPLWIRSVDDIGDDESERDLTVEVAEEPVLRYVFNAAPLSVDVFEDALILFDFNHWEPAKVRPAHDGRDHLLRRLTLLNAHIACLHSRLASRAPKHVVDPETVVTRRSKSGVLSSPDPRIPAVAHANNRKWGGWTTAGLIFDVAIGDAVDVVLTEEVTESFDLLDTLLSDQELRLIQVADLVLRSCRDIEQHAFGSALLAAWSVCETLLTQLWLKYVEQQEATPLSSARRRELTGRDFTASVMTEALFLAGWLSRSRYEELNAVRTARNGWVHELKGVQRGMTKRALKLAQVLLRNVENVGLQVEPREFFANY